MSETKPQAPATIAKTLGLRDPNDKRRFNIKRWGWFLLAGIIVVGSIWFVIHARQPKVVQYQTEPVKRGDLVVTVSATGTLAPIKEVQVGIEVSGTIKTVLADYNDRVTIGQVLAELDTTRLEAQALQNQSGLAAAKAKVMQTEATLQEAQVKLARLDKVHRLSGGKVPAPYDLDTAKATLARAKADLASAKSAVEQSQGALNVIRTDLTKAIIHSPINGVVLERSVEPGQTVASQFQAPVLFKLAEDLTQMELQVDVDEADVGVVQAGQEATFTVDAYPDRTFPAKITQVRYGSQTVDGVVTYKTLLTVDNSTLSLRPGMTATAMITVNKKTDVLLVSNAVLRFSPPPATSSAEKKSSGGLLSAMLPKPPRSDTKPPAEKSANSKEQQVWQASQTGLIPVTITKGATDGVMTEIISGAVDAGTELIKAVVASE